MAVCAESFLAADVTEQRMDLAVVLSAYIVKVSNTAHEGGLRCRVLTQHSL